MPDLNYNSERRSPLALADDAGDWARTAEGYRKALSRNGRDTDLLIRYGTALKEMGDLDSAEIAFRGAVSADPTSADAHLRLGELLTVLNRTEEAGMSLRRALSLDPSLTSAARSLFADIDRRRTQGDEIDGSEDGEDPRSADDPRKALIEKSGLFDAGWYGDSYPEAAETGMDPLDHYLAFGWMEGLEPGPNTDIAGYVARYPEVEAAQSNPLLHFLIAGAFQGRSCLTRRHERALIQASSLFDPAWYRKGKPDIGRANPLDHYIDIGAAEGRSPGPLFDARDYLKRNPLVARAHGNPLLHYILCGAQRGRAVLSVDRAAEKTFIAASDLFDRRAYRATYRDVATGDLDPLDHYVDIGAAEGRAPGPRFDAAAYLSATPDVAAAGTNPLLNHLLAEAMKCPIEVPDRAAEKSLIADSELFDADWYAKRQPGGTVVQPDLLDHYLDQRPSKVSAPSADFDTQDYLARYPEIARAGFHPLLHYIVLGAFEHRMIFGIARSHDRAIIAGSALFDADWYRHTYSDVAAAGLDPIDHYLERGAAEGRYPGPLFDAANYVEENADVRAARVNPLLHYLAVGKAEGRVIRSLGRRRRRALRVWSGWPAGPN